MYVAALFFVGFFNLGAWGAVYPYTSELFPTRLRSSAFGMVEGVGKGAAIAGPYIFGNLLDATGDTVWSLTSSPWSWCGRARRRSSAARRAGLSWRSEPARPGDEPLPPPARRQPGRLVPVGGRGLRQGGRAEDSPILLSVGYAACHWCHVMEHESFEDEETARLMNERFVPVKVDREGTEKRMEFTK